MLDLLHEKDEALKEGFGPGRAPRNVSVDGNDVVVSPQHIVGVEIQAPVILQAHRDHPLRLHHLVVDHFEARSEPNAYKHPQRSMSNPEPAAAPTSTLQSCTTAFETRYVLSVVPRLFTTPKYWTFDKSSIGAR